MKRALKVFGGNYDGRHRLIMATTSKTRFCLLTGCKGSHTSETANVIEVPLAMRWPETPFLKKYSPHDAPYIRAALTNTHGKRRVTLLKNQKCHGWPTCGCTEQGDISDEGYCSHPSRTIDDSVLVNIRRARRARRAASSPSADSGVRPGCAKPSRSKTRPDRA